MKRLILLLALLAGGLPDIANAQNVIATRFGSASPTVDTGGAYATGELIGGKLTFTNLLRPTVGTGYLVSVNLVDKAAQAVDLELWLFSSNPTNTTFTDQAAFDLDDADLSKVAAVINLGSATRFALADNSVHFVGSLALPIRGLNASSQASGTLYGALVARGAYTGASASDITIILGASAD